MGDEDETMKQRPEEEAEEDEESEEEEDDEAKKMEQYAAWRDETVPLMYAFVSSTRLEKETALTDVAWLPAQPGVEPKMVPYAGSVKGRVHELMVGVNPEAKAAAEGEAAAVRTGQSYAFLVDTIVPVEFFPKLHGGDPRGTEDIDRITCNQYAVTHVRRRVPLPADVLRVTYSPTQPRLTAARCDDGSVHIIDWTKEQGTEVVRRYKHHEGRGYGLEWDAAGECLATTGYDKLVHIYNTGADRSDPIATFRRHSAEVEQVSWRKHDRNIFATCGADGMLVKWDLRQAEPVAVVESEQKTRNAGYGINCVAYNPYASTNHLLLTGDNDGVIMVRDDRYLGGVSGPQPFAIEANREITCMGWMRGGMEDEFSSRLLVGLEEGRVELYDLRQAYHPTIIRGTEGDAALVGTHYGHKSFVEGVSTPASWDMGADGCVASTEVDGMLQVWRFNEHSFDLSHGMYDSAGLIPQARVS